MHPIEFPGDADAADLGIPTLRNTDLGGLNPTLEKS